MLRPLENADAELPAATESDQVVLGQVVAGWVWPDGTVARGVFATATP